MYADDFTNMILNTSHLWQIWKELVNVFPKYGLFVNRKKTKLLVQSC